MEAGGGMQDADVFRLKLKGFAVHGQALSFWPTEL
jgi:hypothetical protein